MTPRHIRTLAVVCAAAALALAQTPASAQSTAETPVVDVLAEEYSLEAPREIASGWTTFRLQNEGEETHFVFLTRLPEGKTIEEYEVEVGEPFNDIWYPLRDGEIDQEQAMERLAELVPGWFWEAQPMGGPGLVEAGGTAQTTLKLEPGEYVVECYMKTDEGEFHGFEGMIRPLTVKEEPSGAAEPEADVRLTVSNSGIETDGEFTPGTHTVAVHFAEHPEEGFGNDAHLVRLDEGTEVAQVVPWMNWLNVEGLQNPAPFTFLGGTHQMPAGSTAYVTVDLEPGHYAWIAEENAARGLVKEFTVSP